MTLSRRMLTITVMLVGVLMAVSEAPEILTLTDNVANDCESVQIKRVSGNKCLVKASTFKVVLARALFSAPVRADLIARSLAVSVSSRSTRSLLLMLVTQQK
jgi:hypothetical protein